MLVWADEKHNWVSTGLVPKEILENADRGRRPRGGRRPSLTGPGPGRSEPGRVPAVAPGRAVHSNGWESRGSSAGSSGWSRAPSTRPSAAGCSPSRSVTGCSRVLDDGRTLGVQRHRSRRTTSASTSAPSDAERFDVFADALGPRARRGGPRARPRRGLPLHRAGHGHAGEDPRARASGDLEVVAAIKEGAGGRVGALVLPTAAGSARRATPSRSGGSPTATVPHRRPPGLAASRRDPAEPDGYRLVDLGSLNGTTVNGAPVKEHLLARRRRDRHRRAVDPLRGVVGAR